jgi:hypothetical protein
MSSDDFEFNLADYQLLPEEAQDLYRIKPQKRRRSHRQLELFTQIPNRYLVEGVRALNNKQMAVFCAIFFLARFGDEHIVLTADALRKFGVDDMRVRTITLKRLEEAGLITVDWSIRAAPVVMLTLGRQLLSDDQCYFRGLMADAALAPSGRDDRPKGWWKTDELLPWLQENKPDTPCSWWPKTERQLCQLVRTLKTGRIVRRNGLRWVAQFVPRTKPQSENLQNGDQVNGKSSSS